MIRVVFLALALVVGSCASAGDSDVPLSTSAHPISGAESDYDALFAAMGGARLVLLGEATHGTREFYVERHRLTRRLIEERGLLAIALEADWADAARVDAYVRGLGADRSAAEALAGFTRFPRWMWRNREFAEMVEWLRQHNMAVADETERVRIVGVDLYGAEESIEGVTRELQRIDPPAAETVRERYECFAPYMDDLQRYGSAAAIRPSRSCEAVANDVFEELSVTLEREEDPRRREVLFSAVENARVVKNGEAYHRMGAIGGVSTWNLRDHHMVEAMRGVQQHLIRTTGRDGMIAWAHNSHVGDARATDRARYGELNMGQLLREHTASGSTFIVGFSTHTGTVMAASNWGEEPRRMSVRPSLRGSQGALLHQVELPAFYLILDEADEEWVARPRLQRAIGVIYRPMTERQSHYFTSTLREQFDAVIHIDDSEAVTPLE